MSADFAKKVVVVSLVVIILALLAIGAFLGVRAILAATPEPTPTVKVEVPEVKVETTAACLDIQVDGTAVTFAVYQDGTAVSWHAIGLQLASGQQVTVYGDTPSVGGIVDLRSGFKVYWSYGSSAEPIGLCPWTRIDQPADQPTPTPASVTEAPPVAPLAPPTSGSDECMDGELIYVHNSEDLPGDLARTPLVDADRAVIVEMSRPGSGFGGLDRVIVIVPAVGDIWQVNAVAGAETLAGRAFCGTMSAVTDWAITAHVPSLQQASRATDGSQPDAAEIGVYRLHYEEFPGEAAGLIVEKAAPAGPSPAAIAAWIDVSFNDGVNYGPVEIRVVGSTAAAVSQPAVPTACEPVEPDGTVVTGQTFTATKLTAVRMFSGGTGLLGAVLQAGDSFSLNYSGQFGVVAWEFESADCVAAAEEIAKGDDADFLSVGNLQAKISAAE